MPKLRQLKEHGPQQTADEQERERPQRIAKAQDLLVQGMSYREIARPMATSHNTVRRLLGKC